MKHRNDFLAMILSKIKIITIKNNDMKRFYKLLFGTVLFLSLNNVNAQKAEPAKMFKVYEENDFFDVKGHGTDKAYSNGTRLDFFYEKQQNWG